MGEQLPETEARDRFFGLVQRARVAAQDLLEELDEIEDAAGLNGAASRSAELQARVKRSETTLGIAGLDDLSAGILSVFETNAKLGRRFGDVGGRIASDLQQVGAAWPAADDSADVADARVSLERIVADAGRLTIPLRLTEHLAGMSVGRTLDFNDVFADELPLAEQRRQLLRDLNTYDVGGVIDVERGLIYKVSLDRRFRLFTYLAPLLTIILGAGVLVAVAKLDELQTGLPDEWHLNNSGKLLSAYVLVLVGVFLHLIVENGKQRQSGVVPILATNDLLNWLHLRYIGICATIFPILVTVIGLKVLGVGGSEVSGEDLGLFIAAGYSVDSVAGLILTRFDTSAGKTLRRFTRGLDSDESEQDEAAEPARRLRRRRRRQARPRRR